jgi:hypothetical protein
MQYMQNMPNMLAYTIQGGGVGSNYQPNIIIGDGPTAGQFSPKNAKDDTYWIAIMDRNNPKSLVKDFLVPGSSNSTVPAGLDYYMINPQYFFAVTTQCLSTLHVPQGDWFNYLVKYGAGRELQRLEQLNTTLSCGTFGQVGYVLTGFCGVRDFTKTPLPPPPPPSYELSTITNYSTLMMMSLMPTPNGPPYGFCDSYTFKI